MRDIHRLSPTCETQIVTGGEKLLPCVTFHSFGGLARCALDTRSEISDLIVETPTFSHELADLAVGMHNSGVIAAAESLANLG